MPEVVLVSVLARKTEVPSETIRVTLFILPLGGNATVAEVLAPAPAVAALATL